ncbi:MAG: HAMP domain-containing protein [Spirochaetales bacterium]|nr:HAMP domain-containing protein [Spirochaetales bacterium]
MSIRKKLVIFTSLVIVVIFALAGFFITRDVLNEKTESAVSYMEALTLAYANEADALLEVPMDSARTLAQTFSGYRQLAELQRIDTYGAQLGSFLGQNPRFTRVWVYWTPNSILGDKSDPFIQVYLRASGRAYEDRLSRLPENQQIIVDEVLRTGKEALSEPFYAIVNADELFSLSMAAPILIQGRPIGVVGIDIATEEIQTELSKAKLFDTGFGRLLSSEGTVVVHASPARINQTAPEWNDDRAENLRAVILQGDIFTDEYISLVNNQITLKSFVPLRVGNSPDYWFFSTVVDPAEVYRSTYQVITLMVGFMLGSLIAIILSIYWLTTLLLRPLDNVRRGLENIAKGEGDLTQALEISSRDEVGELATHFNSFVANLNTIIRSTREAILILDEAGVGLASSMETTGSSLTQIQRSLTKVQKVAEGQNMSVNSVSSTVEQITGNIGSLDTLIQRQGSSLAESSSAIEEMVANIQSVTKNLESNRTSFLELNSVSEKGYTQLLGVTTTIGSIARQSEGLEEANTIINAIASQTNLLAMNAAIEAAHAGDAGKGFAVVADEIRKLAENAAEQSQTIGTTLNSLKESIDSVVRDSRESSSSFEAIRKSVQQVLQLQHAIRTAMEEQKTGSVMVLAAIEELNRITREVSDGSREMSEGSRSILEEIQQLVEMSQNLSQGVGEMTEESRRINDTMSGAQRLTKQNEEGILQVKEQTGRFKV